MQSIQTIARFLKETPMCFVATVAGAAPKVRPFQFQFEDQGKLWLCTAKSKDVFKQLQANPAVQICAVKEDGTTLRVEGSVALEDNMAVKERILAEQPLIKGIYGTADNPDFTTFCLEHGAYVLFDFSGNPPESGTF